MTHFDKLVEELGWNKPYLEIPLYIKARANGNKVCVFDIANTYDTYKDDLRIDLTFVQNILEKHYPKTIYLEENVKWVLPILVSDYYAHRYDFDNGLIWAKKAMKENNKLTPLQFSNKIREQL